MTDGFYEGRWPLIEGGDAVPAMVVLHSLKTGAQIREPALVTARVREEWGRQVLEKCLAAGDAACGYEHTAGIAVFSPLRQGQIACYDGAQFLLKTLLRKLGPLLPKPVVCVRVGESPTQVEAIAVTDALIQAGARKVLLYRGALSGALERAAEQKELRHAVVVSIEPQA